MRSSDQLLSRRSFGTVLAASVSSAAAFSDIAAQDRPRSFQLNYILASSLYGCTELEAILPEVRRSGAAAIDIWPRVHGNQREQVAIMGEEAFVEMLSQAGVTLGCLTQYPLGPFGLKQEMAFAERMGCSLIVTGGHGPKGRSGDDLKQAVGHFVRQMEPHLEAAAEHNVTVAIENHGNGLFETADALKWLADLCPDRHLGIALAPYHLPQDSLFLADLIRTLGDRIQMFYAWQHGHGCMKKLPKEEELLQMPGRGRLDFRPLLEALRDIGYRGWTEVFMHPVPRGVPIMDTTSQVTEEVNRARTYLESCLIPV